MDYTKVLGKIDPALVERSRLKIQKILIGLAARYDNIGTSTGIGGDPFIFTLVSTAKHFCTLAIPTAATDGRQYYWNPKFILNKSPIGLRILIMHEAHHCMYMHPSRRGSRNPKLWNIAVDYIVNGGILEDFQARGLDSLQLFKEHLGKFKTLEEYATMIKNVKNVETNAANQVADTSTPIALPAPDVDRELTDEEIQELERREKKEYFFFADLHLPEEMKRPEKIYDYLLSLLPKCPKCGSIGRYHFKKSKDKSKDKSEDKKDDKKDDGDKPDKKSGKSKGKKSKPGDQPGDQPGDKPDGSHDHGDGQSCDCPNHQGDQPGDQSGDQGDAGDQPGNSGGGSCQGDSEGSCGECSGGYDVFDLGGTVDDHMDSNESPEKMAKRIADAIYTAKKLAGKVPSSVEDELGILTAPRVTWKDFIRRNLMKSRAGNERNDWNRFRSRPMFSGMLIPKRKGYFANVGVLLDTSGSMSPDDMAFGVSQLASLDEKSELTVVSCDAQCYWDTATKIKKCNVEELKKINVTGRGGTMFSEFFSDYEENIGPCDFLIVITDGYLGDADFLVIPQQNKRPVEVIWLITSDCVFEPPFGKVFQLRSL